MSKTAIQVEQLTKRYRLGMTVRSPLAFAMERLRGSARHAPEDLLWALRNVSFSVNRGEVLGVIGRNGAGKSTLLKVLSRITRPTSGRVTIHGRVASLLEVGTGFHPELTGRDNIFLNGSILGMTRVEIRRQFDEIVAFAGVERFLDTPVKRYSSGMYVRLAFAVAAHLQPEILLVDEVLAVGDVVFQQKCLGKMQSIADSGRTVLFVSHNLAAVTGFCSRCIRVNDGMLVDDGPPTDVVGGYLAEHFDRARETSYAADAERWMQVRRLALCGADDDAGGTLYRHQPFALHIDYDINRPISGPELIVSLEKPDGTVLCQTRDVDDPTRRRAQHEPGRYRAVVPFPADVLASGTYVVKLLIERTGGWEILDQPRGLQFELHDPPGQRTVTSGNRPRPGYFYLPLDWRISPREPAPRPDVSVASFV